MSTIYKYLQRWARMINAAFFEAMHNGRQPMLPSFREWKDAL